MTSEEMTLILQSSTGVTDTSLLTAYLSMAKDIVLKTAFPFNDISALDVPYEYQSNQVDIAAYLLNKRGSEGELSHAENGITRTYEAGSIPYSLLKGIVPHTGFPS